MDNASLKNLIRIGLISSVNVERMTARAVFPDKDNMVSGELKLLNRGSKKHKDYYIPDVGEQVVCVFPQNGGGKGSNTGFILGSFFSTADEPVKTGSNLRRIDYGEGSYIEYDNGRITIHASGDLVLEGANVRIN